jgi:hypothetical protein
VGPATVSSGGNLIQNSDSNKFQIIPNFDWSKKNLLELKKFEMRYGCEWFEEGNNFLHRNLFRFEMGFE